MRAAVFLDRDGVINFNPPNYVKHWGEFCFLPGALAALERLARLELAVVVATNQSAVGRGILSLGDVDAIHGRMLAEIRQAGGRVDGVYVCPHRPDAGCGCRKPQPGLLLRAAAELGLRLEQSVMVGDSLSDVGAAQAAGVRPALVRSGRWLAGEDGGGPAPEGCAVFDDLGQAVHWIEQEWLKMRR